jgi:hypothetical protein
VLSCGGEHYRAECTADAKTIARFQATQPKSDCGGVGGDTTWEYVFWEEWRYDPQENPQANRKKEAAKHFRFNASRTVTPRTY